MGLKEVFEKQGGMNLLKQYWNGGAFFTAVGELMLLGTMQMISYMKCPIKYGSAGFRGWIMHLLW